MACYGGLQGILPGLPESTDHPSNGYVGQDAGHFQRSTDAPYKRNKNVTAVKAAGAWEPYGTPSLIFQETDTDTRA